jgi:hypothetical protein
MHTHQVGFNFKLYKMHGEYNIKYLPIYFATKGKCWVPFDTALS